MRGSQKIFYTWGETVANIIQGGNTAIIHCFVLTSRLNVKGRSSQLGSHGSRSV